VLQLILYHRAALTLLALALPQVKSRPDDVGAERNLSVKSDLNEARKTMGYCPQFDGIQPNMTAREHLRFYAMIRGVPPQSLEHAVEELLGRMDLVKYADRQVGVPHLRVSVPSVESSGMFPPHRPRENGHAHPADTSRSNLASALGLLSRWRLSTDVPGEGLVSGRRLQRRQQAQAVSGDCSSGRPSTGAVG
jgi:hypothetical protein